MKVRNLLEDLIVFLLSRTRSLSGYLHMTKRSYDAAGNNRGLKSLLADRKAKERFESLAKEREEARKPLSRVIRESEVLTEQDFAVRINTR